MGERRPCKAEATGSSPVSSTISISVLLIRRKLFSGAAGFQDSQRLAGLTAETTLSNPVFHRKLKGIVSVRNEKELYCPTAHVLSGGRRHTVRAASFFSQNSASGFNLLVERRCAGCMHTCLMV